LQAYCDQLGAEKASNLEFQKVRGEADAAHEELSRQHDLAVQRLKELIEKTSASDRQFTEELITYRKDLQGMSESLQKTQAQLKETIAGQHVLLEGVDVQRKTLDEVASRQLDIDQRMTNLLKDANDLDAGVGTLRDELNKRCDGLREDLTALDRRESSSWERFVQHRPWPAH